MTKGYTLSLTFEEIESTIKIIPADFFVCSHLEFGNIASAIVFRIAKNIAQVIYWGDIPEYSHIKTMNFLSFKLFEFYKLANIEFVDVGTAMLDSVPNYGLCDFKESIGCNMDMKYSFFKEL